MTAMSNVQSSTPRSISRPETLPREPFSKQTTKWNSNSTDTEVINIKNFLHHHASQYRRQRENRAAPLDDRIVINICGDRYETHRTTLELYPETLLGNPKRRKHYYDPVHEEYFFDRHRACFQAILYYYQSHGRLRRPEYIPLDIFLEEVTFFHLGREALNQIRKDENIDEVKKIRLPKNHLRRWLWATMEYPDYSCLAKVVNALSLVLVLISTITLAVESLPQYIHSNDFHCRKEQNLSASAELYICRWYYTSPFFIIQLICVAFFTVELFVRLISTPSLTGFVKNPMNWIDLLAVLPFFITMGIRLSGRDDRVGRNTYAGLRFLRVLRLARAFKFCRVVKSVKSLRVLVTTIRQSLLDFLTMIIILTLLGFLFGSAAYYAENDSNTAAFDSILKATYWGIVSITSVGYGDITPITPIGRIIGCLCALFGAATIGMLVSVLVDRYQRVYAQRLYIQGEQIDFSDYSDDENNERESNETQYTSRYQRNSKIEDPDARAKQSAMPQTSESSFEEAPEEDMGQQNGSRIRFIIGYADDDQQKVSGDSIVTNKQRLEEKLSTDLLSDHTGTQVHAFGTHCNLESSDDEGEQMTFRDRKNRRNVLRPVDRRELQGDDMGSISERLV